MSKSYSIHKLDYWEYVTRDEFLACAQKAPWGLGKWEIFKPLLNDIRACIPVDGTDDWTKDIHVIVEEGKRIPEHKHAEWTAIFYVDVGDPPCAILIEDERVIPKPGDVVVLRPDTRHEVEISKSERERISFAMLVEVPT